MQEILQAYLLERINHDLVDGLFEVKKTLEHFSCKEKLAKIKVDVEKYTKEFDFSITSKA